VLSDLNGLWHVVLIIIAGIVHCLVLTVSAIRVYTNTLNQLLVFDAHVVLYRSVYSLDRSHWQLCSNVEMLLLGHKVLRLNLLDIIFDS